MGEVAEDEVHLSDEDAVTNAADSVASVPAELPSPEATEPGSDAALDAKADDDPYTAVCEVLQQDSADLEACAEDQCTEPGRVEPKTPPVGPSPEQKALIEAARLRAARDEDGGEGQDFKSYVQSLQATIGTTGFGDESPASSVEAW